MSSRKTSRKHDSRQPSRRLVSAAVRACVTEALEDRRLFAVNMVSVGLNGAPANGPSGEASASASGRLVVFSSYASNLVEGDTNGKSDIFLRNLDTNTTTLISRRQGGEIGNGDSVQPVISQDGTHVAFVSAASNLLPNDTLGNRDVFRYTIATGLVELVSARNAAGEFPSNGSSEPTISADGNLVSFTTAAGNLTVQGGPAFFDANGTQPEKQVNDVFVRNLGTTQRFGIDPKQNRLVSVNAASAGATSVTTGNKQSLDSWISEDGRYVTFRSDANDLVAGGADQNDKRDTYLRDLQTGTTTLISVNGEGKAANQESQSNSVSGNGQFVLFQSKANDITGNDGNDDFDIFLRDTVANTTRLLTVNRNGNNSAGGLSEFPAMSQNGAIASYSSYAPDIVPGDVNNREDVFIRDLVRGPLTVLSVTPGPNPQTANGRSYDPFINRNGTHVVFTSNASNMTAGDTNAADDIFIADVPAPGSSNGQPDTVAPTATFGQVLATNATATSVDFTVNLKDDRALNTVQVGSLTVTRAAAGSRPAETFTVNKAPNVPVIGTGTDAVVTYRVTFTSGTAADNAGDYTIAVPAGAFTDAAGNAIAAGTLAAAGGAAGPTFALTSGTQGNGENPGTGGPLGDPNGPDVQIVTPGKAPASVIGGRKGSFKWKARNGGPGLLNHNVTFSVYASADQAFDAGDTPLATVTRFLKKMRTGKSKGLSAKFLYPADIGNGNYYLLVQADTANGVAESNEANNTGTSPAVASIRQPFTDLQPTLVGKPSRASAGAEAVVSVVLKNNGNVSFKAGTPIAVALSSDATVDGGDRVLTTVTPTVSIKNGKTKSVKLKVPLPADLAPGTYFVGVNVDPANVLAEGDEANNAAASTGFTSI